MTADKIYLDTRDICRSIRLMPKYSTREVAQKLGLDWRTLQRYISARKIPVPPLEIIGGGKYRAWSDEDIENVRKLLPKIANGRKTRWQKQREAEKKKQAKAKKKTPARAPVPRKKK
jgi:predicted DNA-binding transcriptional regulator AlpA